MDLYSTDCETDNMRYEAINSTCSSFDLRILFQVTLKFFFIGLAVISNFILNYLQVPKFDFLEFEKSFFIVRQINLYILLPMNMCVGVGVFGG